MVSLVLPWAALALFVTSVEGKSMHEVRTYMAFTYPVDPAEIQTIPDMDMSYALAATLVEWDAEKQISAGLAESWKVVEPNAYRFTLRENARWSDGTPVTCADVKKSFDRGMKAHPSDLRSLINMLDAIECPSSREIDFKLNVPAQASGLLGKLTEPNFGVLRIKGSHTLDLSITTGAFSLSPRSSMAELTLLRNTHWHRYDQGAHAPERVSIRRSPSGFDAQSALLTDSWPNLIETSSLVSADILKRYQAERFEVWKRPLDKLFHFQLGKRITNADGLALVRFLRQKISGGEIVSGLSGYALATQMFPRGYHLHDPTFSCPKTRKEDGKLPDRFRNKPIEILFSSARVSSALQQNVRRVISEATGREPRFISVELNKLGDALVGGDYDLYMGTVGLADPDPEGAMSYYLEGEAPVIQSAGNRFLERLDSARKEKSQEAKLSQMRSILTDAVCEGYILPLFHLSTIGIGRAELDFSQISTSDESVTLSKIRFRKPKH